MTLFDQLEESVKQYVIEEEVPLPPVYTPRTTPTVAVAEIGDDFETLAERYDVDALDMQRLNGDTTVQAGAAYTLPTKPLASPVLTEQEWPEWVPPWFREWYEENTNLEEGEPGTAQWALDFATNIRRGAEGAAASVVDFFRNIFGEIDTTGGVGTGAGIGPMKPLASTVPAQRPWEMPAYGQMTGPPAPTTPVPTTRVPTGFLEQEAAATTTAVQEAKERAWTDWRMQEAAATQAPSPIPAQGTDEYYDWLVEQSPYRPGTPEFFAWANEQTDSLAQPQPPAPSARMLEDMDADELWEFYLDPRHKGRGGGLVGYLEERLGIPLDPEDVFTSVMDDSLLDAIMEEFQDEPETINYLVGQGVLVPVNGEGKPATVAGTVPSGAVQKYTYPTPAYYGNTYDYQEYRRPATIGLVSWSI